jgi:hypothetical protein
MSGSVTSKVFLGSKSSNRNRNTQNFKLPMHRIQPDRKGTLDRITGKCARTQSIATTTFTKEDEKTVSAGFQEREGRSSDSNMCSTHIGVDLESLQELFQR